MKVRTPGDIVSSLPALLGYHAEKSIVLILLGGSTNRIELTMRLDLPTRFDDATCEAVWQAFVPGVTHADADEAVVVLLDADPQPAQALVDAVADGLAEHGIGMRDLLVVTDGRYRSLMCRDTTCCPPEGNPVPGTSALTAAAVATGTVIRARRDDLRSEIASPDEAAAQRAETVIALLMTTACDGSLQGPADDFAGYLDEACACASSTGLGLDQAARLACLVAVGDFRDQAYLHMVTTDPLEHRALWAAVCRQVPPQSSVVPRVLFALAAYLDGQGALATVALESAEEVDPTHPSLRLISDVLAAGIPPRDVRAALAECMRPQR